MLKKILSGSVCAECRLCCVFDSSDVWETPVFTERTKEILVEKCPEAEFAPKGDGYALRVGKIEKDELFRCPALTENGCMLGDDKPFDCRIWPYRIMHIGGRRAITIASICEEMYNRPLSQLVEFLKEGLAEKIFDYAHEHPEIVKPYEEGYPVILFEDK